MTEAISLITPMPTPEVLIIGAGPSGLMMACQLAMRHIPFRIVDKTFDHTSQSRAIVIHARSLEIFEQMGIAQMALQQGKIAKAANLLVNGKRRLRFEFTGIGNHLTKFPYLLMLEQSKTEAILNEFLHQFGHSVERNTELISVFQHEAGITAILQQKGGVLEVVETHWLIGADGAHSQVRQQLGVPFLGKTYQESLFVLDCEVSMPLAADEMYLSFSKDTFAGFFPLPTGRCRVIGIVPKEYQQHEEITFSEVNARFAERTGLNITLRNPAWIAKYLAHHRVVSAFRKGSCFLVGDAAHIHSPVGAQGMNTGLQDAYNLAWKLALVIRQQASEKLLDTYQEERLSVAQQLVKTTDRVFHMVTSEKWFWKAWRLHVLPPVLQKVAPIAQHFSFIRKKAFTTVSEIGLQYRLSSLSRQDPSAVFPRHSPKPGDRLPYSALRKEFTEGVHFHLVVFAKSNRPERTALSFQQVLQPYADILQVQVISFNPSTQPVFEQFGIREEGLYLIRPDSYIAYRSQSLATEPLSAYLNDYL